ncbi:MAG: hypothetical protein L7T23_01820 [Alphaproteobacteria bacterium]|nr:hypothetical protein [Alphaproteobacteria bacterium]
MLGSHSNMATFLISMFFKPQKNCFLIFFFLILNIFNTSSFAKVNVSEVSNEIFILDIYGKRYVLDNTKQIKKGDYLKTRKKPAYLILNDRTKICLAANTSLKILNVKNIDDKIEISLDFNKGVLLLEMNEDQSNIYNLHFSSYQLNDLRSDIILSNKKKMELINFEGQLKFYSKTSKKNNKAEAYKAYELMPNADMKISYEILNLDQFNQKFHGDCEKVLPQFTTKKNKKWEMQYGCITQNGRLVCGNRYK